MPDSAAVDAAVFAVLNDPTLKGLLPDGVYRDVAPQSKTKVAVVLTPTHSDTDQFQDTAYETFSYLVKAVTKDNSVITANNAAARIDQLMRALPSPAGYVLMIARRRERVAYSEPDPSNPDLFWQHRGGLYDVMVSPA